MTVPKGELRHLLARTGFGVPTAAEMAELGGGTYDDVVARLLNGVATDTVTPSPDLSPIGRRGPALQGLTQAERQKLQRAMQQDRMELKGWWWGEMLATQSPLTEHLVLFWHNHFTSSLQKVKAPELLRGQNALYRTQALGNFAGLLRAATKDPAMVVYLDSNLNRAGSPNENFARELLELFTLGEGHVYTETDIREAARAFTGWRYGPQVGFVFDRRSHDGGAKTFLGESGNLNGDDIVEIVLRQPRVAAYIAEKFWREFVSDSPDAVEAGRLAATFRESGYELRALLEALLLSDAFRDQSVRGTLVKSPVDLVAGTYRLIGAQPRDTRVMAMLGRSLGQDLFDPPNVKGWPGGLEWIDTANLPARHGFLFNTAEAVGAAGGTMPNTVPRRPGQQGGPAPAGVGGAAAALPRIPPLQLPVDPTARDLLRQRQLTPPLDMERVSALLRLDTRQLAELVLPLPQVGTGIGLAGLLLDPAYQLK